MVFGGSKLMGFLSSGSRCEKSSKLRWLKADVMIRVSSVPFKDQHTGIMDSKKCDLPLPGLCLLK